MKREPLDDCVDRTPSSDAFEIPAHLWPGNHEKPLYILHAQGVLIYECRPSPGDSQAMEWVFVEPEAHLTDETGRLVGRHFMGPGWQHLDGSELVGVLEAFALAPQEGALNWQLLKTRSVGPDGAFAGVTSIQRINTGGGKPPSATHCTPRVAGARAQVPYHADYVMYGPK